MPSRRFPLGTPRGGPPGKPRGVTRMLTTRWGLARMLTARSHFGSSGDRFATGSPGFCKVRVFTSKEYRFEITPWTPAPSLPTP